MLSTPQVLNKLNYIIEEKKMLKILCNIMIFIIIIILFGIHYIRDTKKYSNKDKWKTFRYSKIAKFLNDIFGLLLIPFALEVIEKDFTDIVRWEYFIICLLLFSFTYWGATILEWKYDNLIDKENTNEKNKK